MDPMLRRSLRLARWYRRPPSRRRIIMMAVVLGFSLGLVAVERFIGWPAWATLGDSGPRSSRH